MVRYRYFVSYVYTDNNLLTFGSRFFILNKLIQDEEDIRSIVDEIKKRFQVSDVVIINYIVMKVIENG